MPISTEAIGLVGVSKAYPGVHALDDINFSVQTGRVHGFLGPNGAGKSTTMNIITGLLHETSGTIRLMGQECPPSHRKKLIGYLPEQPPIYPQMIVKKYLEFVAALYGKKNQEAVRRVDYAIEACGLYQVVERMIGNLSKGYKQRVGIAQALVLGSKILILDEPTVGLDPVSVTEIRNLIQNLKGEHTVLLSSHLLHEISLVCDDITMINHGKLVATGTLQEIQNRFSSAERFILKAEKFNKDIVQSLKSNFGINSIEDKQSWTLQTSRKVEAKQLLAFLVDQKADVTEFYQDKTQLEDIFKLAMNEGAS